MASPADVPRRPAWRYEALSMAGVQVIPALANNDIDRKKITERLSANHEDEDNIDDYNDTSA